MTDRIWEKFLSERDRARGSQEPARRKGGGTPDGTVHLFAVAAAMNAVPRARKTAMLAMALLIVPSSDGARAIRVECVDGGAHRGRRGGGAPGVVGERVYARQRHVSALGGGIGRGDRCL